MGSVGESSPGIEELREVARVRGIDDQIAGVGERVTVAAQPDAIIAEEAVPAREQGEAERGLARGLPGREDHAALALRQAARVHQGNAGLEHREPETELEEPIQVHSREAGLHAQPSEISKGRATLHGHLGPASLPDEVRAVAQVGCAIALESKRRRGWRSELRDADLQLGVRAPLHLEARVLHAQVVRQWSSSLDPEAHQIVKREAAHRGDLGLALIGPGFTGARCSARSEPTRGLRRSRG